MSNNFLERFETLHDGHPFVGRPCVVCEKALEPGAEALACPRCKSLHHKECWIQNAGCGARGCPQVASIRPAGVRQTDDDRARQYRNPVLTAAAVAAVILLIAGMLGYTYWTDRNKPQPDLTLLVPDHAGAAALQDLVDAYGDERGLHIELLLSPYGGQGFLYNQKLLVMMAAGDIPDIIFLSEERLRAFASAGRLVSLEAIAQRQPWRSESTARRVPQGYVDGVLFGAPHPTRHLFIAIPEGGKNPDEAIEFVAYIFEHTEVGPEDEAFLEEDPAFLPFP